MVVLNFEQCKFRLLVRSCTQIWL